MSTHLNVFSVLQISDQSVLEVMVVRLFHQNYMRSSFNDFPVHPARRHVTKALKITINRRSHHCTDHIPDSTHSHVSELVSGIESCLIPRGKDYARRFMPVQPEYLGALHTPHKICFCKSHTLFPYKVLIVLVERLISLLQCFTQ